ncbi:MAG: glutamate racemase [Lachnospiraceae bacterium]|nr:glutamate racemase [Lachnospiraceae bacterium]
MEEREKPIGVFDSGLGGISVLRELVKIMPNEDYIYFGDSKNAPYGTKTSEEVWELTSHTFRYLLKRGVKAVVIACNTATSAAVRRLRQEYPEIPIVGIEPALKPAVLYRENSRVVVMATPMTLRREKFRLLMAKYEDRADIRPLPCPGLMEFIEKGILTGPELDGYLTDLFLPLRSEPIDSVVLGCTHYPFIREEILKVLGGGTVLFDGGEGTARELRRRVLLRGLGSERTSEGRVAFENSLPGEEMKRRAIRLFTGTYM